MGEENNEVSKGCLFGFGFAFGLILAQIAAVGVIGAMLVVGCVIFTGLGTESVRHIESESEYTPEIIESLPPGHVETQTGVKGVLVDRDGNYVDIRLPDGTSTYNKQQGTGSMFEYEDENGRIWTWDDMLDDDLMLQALADEESASAREYDHDA